MIFALSIHAITASRFDQPLQPGETEENQEHKQSGH